MKAIKDIEYMYTMQEITDIVDELFPIDDSCNIDKNGWFIDWRNREARGRKDYVTGLFLKLWNINLWLKGEIEPYKYVTHKEIQEKKEERQRVYDELCKELGILTVTVDNEKETGPKSINTKPQQEKQKPTRGKGRPKRTFKDCMKDDDDGSKLQRIHKIIDGRYGKDVSLIIVVCIEKGWITTPTYTQVKNEFGDIGSKTGYNKYLKKERFTKEELEGAMRSLDSQNKPM